MEDRERKIGLGDSLEIEPWMASKFWGKLSSLWGFTEMWPIRGREITVLDLINLRCPLKIQVDFSRSLLSDQWTGEDWVSKWKESLACEWYLKPFAWMRSLKLSISRYKK